MFAVAVGIRSFSFLQSSSLCLSCGLFFSPQELFFKWSLSLTALSSIIQLLSQIPVDAMVMCAFYNLLIKLSSLNGHMSLGCDFSCILRFSSPSVRQEGQKYLGLRNFPSTQEKYSYGKAFLLKSMALSLRSPLSISKLLFCSPFSQNPRRIFLASFL